MRVRTAFVAVTAAAILMPAAAVQAEETAGPAAVQQAVQAPPPDSQFQKVTLNDNPGEPMDLAVLPDSRVLHTTRKGEVWLHDPKTGLNTLAAKLTVYQHDEEGLQSIALSPGFGKGSKKDDWVYLYYSPPLNTPVDNPATPNVNEGDAPFTGTPADFAPFKGLIRLSRFRFGAATIDLRTEQRIMDVPVDRGICCHVGGDIVFDAAGNLYLSTGDDTNPFQSDGYTPIDERADRNPAFDAQRSSANTNDLRGKILRIKVRDNGSYVIPRGNLFKPGTSGTRPEIYAMGWRNPFRIELNRRNGDLYVADYSPDARAANPARGPSGTGKWTIVRKAGNYGWPYCATARLPYVDYDFATLTSGATFNCAAPVNESPRNTGLRALPPVVQPDVWYSYGASAEFPALGTGGIGPMAGPAYDFDVRNTRGRTATAWPKYYDEVPLFYEWTRDYVKAFHRDGRIEDVLSSFVFDNPMDIEFGPEGSLYVLEYGDGFFSENPDAQLARIDYIGNTGNHTPTPVAAASVTAGLAPLTVNFTSTGTTDADGDRLRYAWDFNADGRVDSRSPQATYTYRENGLYNATLRVTDTAGMSAATSVRIVVGNAAPVVTMVRPVAGQPFAFGDLVQFEVQVTDDQPVNCANVTVDYILGHDEHGHPQTTARGCTGTIQTTLPGGHDPGDNLTGVFVASYTDPGTGGLPPLTTSTQVVLEPTS
ncbi:PKD domain-containing protein [Nonomuraea solani]|uniref:PKD domain-containing protein n=1 Tax=Nonomuraea solani TaxID=1144553 RepID=A0A1H6ELJ3_9ACTN|nr:PQQ-dependent sugar dehydrogenase [Nonomuraea solani]SEG97896.1 PKD domain-containing protein [Nonomuraea solani]